ncbi:hypothetical protein CYLTODRAFT_423902 [Cylindrobasidium torrendii FP15055 ss-10]|uniref:C2H2-type domain-containing protein n=1 Tax=Cylindrobasidium torrendii FP15055 ss-10 TaxID=1314674 RepID=A0A0D7B5Z5_9AGAR|nr:hypothetical protein CYLTODRAFT_423902 [Cylindrobasidium torrendii FP15055 ss-10]
MKRRVAGLPPVSAAVFNEKVLERRQETSIMSSVHGSKCEVCNKIYTTENAYRSHIQSKKHKETELRAATRPAAPVAVTESLPDTVESAPVTFETPTVEQPSTAEPVIVEEAEDSEGEDDIDAKIAAARSRLGATQCLFCSLSFGTLNENLAHMSTGHSFFIPEAEYLTDVAGLIEYLGEKIAVGNVCLYCNGKGRALHSLDAVRKHMLDKGHCKLAYHTESERLEFSDYYDFRSSYSDPEDSESESESEAEDQEWEDTDGEEEADETVDAPEKPRRQKKSKQAAGPSKNQITYGDSEYELVLPSGARIGHRSLKRYYAQNFVNLPEGKEVDPNSGQAIVRKMLADKNNVLVPTKGGFGAYGGGLQVVKARNTGEAKEAGRHIKEFRDQKRRENFKTKVGFRHNSQKHYRDPLLQ